MKSFVREPKQKTCPVDHLVLLSFGLPFNVVLSRSLDMLVLAPLSRRLYYFSAFLSGICPVIIF